MTSASLYRTLYVLVHALFSVYRWLVNAVQEIGGVFVDICHEFGPSTSSIYQENETGLISKIPKHITILLGNEQPSFKDMANIISWCMGNQILFLSFYDHKGILKKNQDKLEETITKALPPNNHVIWHNSPNSIYKNGFIGQKIHVKLLSRESGKQALAQVTRNLCKSTINHSDISIESLGKALQKDFEFPDPDLAISFGEYLNLQGYPPWQIRVTEFLSIKSHRQLRYRTFLEQLYVYGKCEQRFGK
ncbi:dehydrodolichyl diphosphate synthase complex subunit Nus1-like [Euwallacea fornicatus]|uniref:dehydrodolichyl diphosphate synthase complex subunit Nus1-like n=1 Tax=Euwallacea fornicatus TaxID=995702 RepID=UPI0033906C41